MYLIQMIVSALRDRGFVVVRNDIAPKIQRQSYQPGDNRNWVITDDGPKLVGESTDQ